MRSRSLNIQRGIIFFFAIIGLNFLLGILLPMVTGALLMPQNASTQEIISVSELTTQMQRIVLYLIPIFIIWFFWKRWHKPKYLIGVAIGAIFTLNIFGIVFAFTFPVWIILGVGALAYGYFTGIFKELPPENISGNVGNKADIEPGKQSFFKRKSVRIVFVLLILFFAFRFPFYGFSLCDERERELPLEDRYVGTTLTFNLSKDVIYFEGGGPSFEAGCTKTQRLAPRDLRTRESISRYGYIYEDYDYSITDVNPNSTFTVEKKFEVSPFGFNSAFGNDIEFYLLRDQDGILSTVPYFTLECLEDPQSCDNIINW